MLTSVSRSVRTLFLLVLSTLFFGLVVPISPASAVVITVTASINDTTPEVGQTLTASATFSPTQGNPSAASYKWQSVTGSDPAVDIPGATSSTYTVTADMETKKLQVVIVSTNGGSNTPGTGTSPQTSPVAKGSFTTQPSVAISDTTPQVDQTVTANVTGTSPSAGVTYAYQWYTITGSDPEVLVAGATSSTFTAADTDLGKKLLVKVIASKAGYNNSNQVSSAATSPVATATFTTPPSVAVSDTTPQVDQTVTANVTGTSPSSGVTYAYQWYSVNGANPPAPISGETGATYTVSGSELGNKLLVKVIASKSGYTNSTEVSSAQTSAVAQADFTSPPTVSIDDTTPTVGQTLTAEGGDAAPSTGTTYSYQWFTVDGSDAPVEISGATGTTYTVVAADVSLKIVVKKTAHKVGYTPSTATSAETAAVAKADFSTPPTVTIDDTTPVVDETLTATASGEVPTSTSYTYQWYTVDGDDDPVAISGAEQSTYVVEAETVGKTIFVRVHAKQAGYNDGIGSSAETDEVIKADFTTDPEVSIDDTSPQVDQEVSAVLDTDAAPSASYTYQWYTVDGSNPAAEIAGADEPTYTATAGDLGLKLQVKVTANRSGYNDSSDASDETSAVAKADFSTAPAVSIDNTTPTVGDEVSAVLDTAAAPTADSYAYQWYTVDGGNAPVAISGATDDSYTVTGDDAGLALKVKVTASKAAYNDASDTSDATAAVAKADFTTAPEVSIDDASPEVDQDLTAVVDTDAAPAGTYTYQWFTDDGVNPPAPISGATNDTYTVTPSDVGLALKVRITASKTGYNDASDTSDATAAVVKADFSTDPEVSIDDTSPTVDQEVEAVLDTASIPAADSYDYQWYTVDGSDPAVAISGATDDKYTVTAGDDGLKLQVRVTASKSGYNDASDTSAETAAVAKADFTGDPTASITGTAKVDSLLTAHASGESPAGTGYTYQWKADGTDISGATSSTFTPGATEVGKTITVTIAATKAGYNPSGADTSDPTAAVAKADFTGTLTVLISDTTPTEGQLLTANPSGESPAGTYAYQWKADGTDISGATSSTFTPGATEVNKALTVTVTATKAGYNDASGTSPATTAVAPATLSNFTTGPTANLSSTTPKVGDTLTANPTGEVPTADSFNYQWYRISALGVKSAMVGEFAKTYVVTPGNLNYKLQVKVTAVKAGYNNKSASSVQTARVNQITLSKSTVARGSTLTVTAKYLRAGQVYRIFIDGVTVYKGTVPSNGTASRTVTVPTSIGTGSKRVWVSGYNKAGDRDFTVLTNIPVT